MEDYNSDLEQPATEPQGKAAETENNLFTIPPLAERDPESLEDDSISGWMLFMYVCIGLGAFLGLLSLKEPGVTPIIRYGVWINLAFAVYTIMAAYKRMRNAVFLAKTYVWVSLLTNVCLILQGALVMPVGAGLKTFTAVGAVISAALLFYLYKSHAVEARFPRNMRRAFVWDWLAILVVFVVPFVTIAVQSYRTTDTIENVEKTPDAKAVKKLKSEIAKMKKQCPMSMGIMDIMSVDYNEDNNIALMRMNTPEPLRNTKRYRDLVKKNVVLAYTYEALKDKTFVKTFSDARASLRITLTSYNTNNSITIKLTPKDFDSIVGSEPDEKELGARVVDVMARRGNELCPYDVDAHTTVISEKVEGNMYVIEGRFDPSLAPETKDVWDALNSVYAQRETKRELIEGYISDPTTASIPQIIVSAEYGIRMIYTSGHGKYTATIEISPEELKEIYESIHREK